MKNILFLSVLLFFITGCVMESEDMSIKKRIIINDSGRKLISGLNDPKVDYILFKDGDKFKVEVDYPLIINEGTYVINLNLVSGSEYKFTEFTIKADGKIVYMLDVDSTVNSDGFKISIDGIFSVTPKVFLKKVTGVIFDSLDYESLSVEIITDESSFLDPVSLTFKVSSNIPDATFKIFKYTIYWVKGPELNQNDIYDMDTGYIFNPLKEGDEDPWGSGKFKIVTTNSKGETVFVVGFSDEWSKKHIHLIL